MTDKTNERDENGRYLPGHKSTGGRLPRAKEESSLNYLHNFLLEDDAEKLKEMIYSGWKHACRGNAQMMRVMLSYFWGQPAQSVDLTTDSVINVTISHERRKDTDTGAP